MSSSLLLLCKQNKEILTLMMLTWTMNVEKPIINQFFTIFTINTNFISRSWLLLLHLVTTSNSRQRMKMMALDAKKHQCTTPFHYPNELEEEEGKHSLTHIGSKWRKKCINSICYVLCLWWVGQKFESQTLFYNV